MKKLNFLIGILYFNTVGLVIVAVYLILGLLSVSGEVNTSTEPSNTIGHVFLILFCVWLLIYVLFAVINIIALVTNYKRKEFHLIYQKMKRIKTGLIPYWVINFICYLPISAFLLLVGHGFGFIIVPIFIFASYTVLVVTSTFSIAYLLYLRTSNKINDRGLFIHVIWQSLFIADIIDTYRIIRKYKYEVIQDEKTDKDQYLKL